MMTIFAFKWVRRKREKIKGKKEKKEGTSQAKGEIKRAKKEGSEWPIQTNNSSEISSID